MTSVAVTHCRLPFANALAAALSSLPASDRTWFSESSTISDVRTWCAAKADENHRYTLAFRAIQNILAPIHHLPPEILSRIFAEAWQDRRSLRLTHVCRIWRSVLLDTSQFWAVAIAGDKFRLQRDEREISDEAYLDAACLRSAPRSISIHLSSISYPRGHLQLTRHADRIASMQIAAHTRDQLKLLWNVLHTGVPRLENLAVYVSDSVGLAGRVGPGNLSTKELPVLTRLILPTPLFHKSWPNTLQELGLRPHPDSYTIALETVLALLQDYPRLRALDIRYDAFSYNPRFQLPPLALPMLKVPTPHVIHDDTFVHGPAADAVTAVIDQVTIECGPTCTIHGHADGVERLRFSSSFYDQNWFEIGTALRVFARTNAPVSRLLVAQHPTQRMPVYLDGPTIFPAFPHLTHLAIHGRRNMCSELLAALCPPRVPASGSGAGLGSGLLPLPLLQHLTVGFATKRRSEISNSLRRGGIAGRGTTKDRCPGGGGVIVVAVHFRECCRVFPGVLGGRRRLGHRLSRLEFFSYEEGCMAKPSGSGSAPGPVVSHVDLRVAALDSNLVGREIERLRGLVDGPVVFSGYRFFAQA